MRMSLMFAAVTLLTGINLFFIPFQPVPALWGAILAVAFVLINVVADKLRLWIHPVQPPGQAVRFQRSPREEPCLCSDADTQRHPHRALEIGRAHV